MLHPADVGRSSFHPFWGLHVSLNHSKSRLLKPSALFAALFLMPALAPAADAPAATKVVQGAEWVSPPSLPVTVTVDMQRLTPAPTWKPGDPLKEIPRLFFGDPNRPVPVPANPVYGDDPLVAKQQAYGSRQNRAFGTPLVNIDVVSSAAVSPNDPTGDIGPQQFVASVNGPTGALFAAYNKTTGAQVVAPTLMETLGTGAPCNSGLGDPIVLFDEQANRWMLTEFTSGANVLCVYLSDVADLSGTVTWTRYAFTLTSFPDYPKYGVWTDAYYVGANQGNALYAMDRQKMLAGQAATLQRFTIPDLAGFNFQMAQPADIAGTDLPAAGEPGIFLRHRDDEVHNAGSNNPTTDFIEMFTFKVDWTTPANSAIVGPVSFGMSEFSSALNGLTAFNAFPQPGGQKLDPLRETVMHRVTYRRFADHESLVGNLVTDLFLGAGSTFPDDTGAVRWFELRRPTGTPDGVFDDGFESVARSPNAEAWTVYQEGTYAPADGLPAEQADRWMAGSSIDSSGNIALAYNVVRQAPAISVGARYTGRLSGDALGVMTAGENNIIAGTGNIGNERWGDYNDMGIDPVDGCTFWFIGGYSNGGSRVNRAASFKFDECGAPTFTLGAPAPSVSICANSAVSTDAPPITLNAAATNGFVGAVVLTYPNPFPTGISGTLTPSTIPTLPGSSVAQLSANNTATPGATTIVARGTSGAITRNVNLTLNLATATPAVPTLTAPASGATSVATSPTFTWAAVAQAASYVVEASTSNTFATTLFSQSVTGTSLVSPVAMPANTQIFWRVRAVNSCGTGLNSTVSSFTTANVFCFTGPLSIPDNTPAGVNADIVIPPGAPAMTSLRISVNATHTWIGDLAITLSKDGGAATSVYSPSTTCSGDNMAINVYDSAAGTANTCANATPAVAADIKPAALFGALNTISPSGTWRLNIADRANIDTGTLNTWCLTPN